MSRDFQDQELDELLRSFKHVRPSEIQLQRWSRRIQKPRSNWVWMTQIVAAAFVGFVVGAIVFQSNTVSSSADSGATEEFVYYKNP